MGHAPILPPDGGERLFASVRPFLKGDVVFGNLEQAFTEGGASKCGPASRNCFAFRTPASYARHLKEAGFTLMNLANNHSYDFGPAGLSDTVAALDAVGMGHTGRPGEIASQREGGARVAILGFAPYSTAQDLRDIPAAQSLVREADLGADLVIVTMHAGAEGPDRMHVSPGPKIYAGESRGDPIAFARAVVEAGADLVVGHGPHVLRGMEWHQGRLIAYSLGNFSGYRNFNLEGALGTTAILRVTLRSDGSWVSGKLEAVRIVEPGIPLPDPSGAAYGIVRDLSRQDFARRGVQITPTGGITPP